MLLTRLLDAFVPEGPVVMGIDETIERRRGEKIAAQGIYRDAVRSSHTHVVNASGRRWVCLMVRAPLPWSDGIWALPCLTVLAPSERDDMTRDGGLDRCWTEDARRCGWCTAGCPPESWSEWAITRMRPSNGSRPCARRRVS
jgi:hypothetical protein